MAYLTNMGFSFRHYLVSPLIVSRDEGVLFLHKQQPIFHNTFFLLRFNPTTQYDVN